MDTSQLKSGDILLYHGSKGVITWAINKLDGAPSHAGIYAGNGKVYHATRKGAHETSLLNSAKTYDKISIVRLKSYPIEMGPVVDYSQSLLNRPYDFSQVILIALIILTAKTSRYNNYLARLVTHVLGVSARKLYYAIKHGDRRLTCSEYSYRSYVDCKPEPNDEYNIDLGDREVYTRYPSGDQILLKSNKEYTNFEKDSLLHDFFNDPNKDNEKTVVIMEEKDIDSFVKRWNSDDPRYSPQVSESKVDSEKTKSLLDDYLKDDNHINLIIDNQKDINGEDSGKTPIPSISSKNDMDPEEEKEMQIAIKDFVLMHGQLIEYKEQEGFVKPPEDRYVNGKIKFEDYTLYRDEFVTAKDIFEAKNLEEIGIIEL